MTKAEREFHEECRRIDEELWRRTRRHLIEGGFLKAPAHEAPEAVQNHRAMWRGV